MISLAGQILQFESYELEAPKYDVDECQQRGLTFASPLKVTLRLMVWEIDEDTGSALSATSKNKMSIWAICP